MRVLVCPTAFKGTLTAAEAARAIRAGVREALPDAEVRAMPVSDGGPGLLEAILASHDPAHDTPRDEVQDARGGKPAARLDRVRVAGPLGEPVQARILRPTPDEAVLESADACGLERLASTRSRKPSPEGDEERRRPPLDAHTAGVGELVRRAIGAGARRVSIGLGGSASTDGGTGLARAFGFRFLDSEGRPLPPGGGALVHLRHIEPGSPPGGEFLALYDVVNPLNGSRGAARVFAPQKGATAEEVELLEAGLERLAERLRTELGTDVAALPGAGAAGGLGAGCAAFLGARLVSGSEWVLERVGFARALDGVDLVVTGEGAWDRTSRAGKVVGRVLERARAAGVPALLLCGRLDPSDDALARESGAVLVMDGGGTRLDSRTLAALAASGIRRFREGRPGA